MNITRNKEGSHISDCYRGHGERAGDRNSFTLLRQPFARRLERLGLKALFLVHFIAALIFGLPLLLVPAAFMGVLGVRLTDPEAFRLVGAAVLSVGASSWYSYKAAEWEKVKIVVQTEIVWTVLAALAILYGLLFAGTASALWLNAVIMAGFAVAFIYYYSKK